jgi:hypothetical protein
MPALKFDSYTLRARIAPAFLALLPMAVSAFLWAHDVVIAGRLAGVVLGQLGVAMLIAQLGRDQGYVKQPGLWREWGGAPTTQLLRHRNTECNPVLRDAYHRKLRELLPDITLPTREEEERDPEKADQVYEACAKSLIARTRARDQFPLIFHENVNYGFRRNLWALKRFGTVIAIVGVAACGLYLWHGWERSGQISAEAAITVALNLGLLLLWVFRITPCWVRIPAHAYAARLYEACVHLTSEGVK